MSTDEATMFADELKIVRSTPLYLEGAYAGRKLSEVLDHDADDARAMGLGEITWRLEDLARHAAQLEAAIQVSDRAIRTIEDELEDTKDLLEDLNDKHHEQINEMIEAHETETEEKQDALLGTHLRRARRVWEHLQRDAQAAIERIETNPAWQASGSPGVVAHDQETARDQVERELHADGVIEDPDIDGGLLG